MQINRKQILASLLNNIQDISDKEYQKRVWIRGEGPECDDFTETCCLFLPASRGVLENHTEFEITDLQYQLLKKLQNAFQAFSDENDFPEEFIDSPEWAKIMDMAKNVLKAFNYQKK
jgi:hypothetical protein